MNNPNKEEILSLFAKAKLGRDFTVERHGGNKCLLKYGPDGDIVADTSNNVKNILQKLITENETGYVPAGDKFIIIVDNGFVFEEDTRSGEIKELGVVEPFDNSLNSTFYND